MEQEVKDVLVNESSNACSIMSKGCLIGKVLLVTGAVGGIALLVVKTIKKIKTKKAAKNAMSESNEDQ